MPTLKQKRAAKILVENSRKSVSAAMREAGYSDVTATHPDKLTNSKGWDELMEDNFPDVDLAKKNKELLNAHRISNKQFNYKIKDKEITELFESHGFKVIAIKRFMTSAFVFYMEPNTEAQDKALEKAYKLKKKYPKEEHDVTIHTYESLIDDLAKGKGGPAQNPGDPGTV